MKLTETDKRQIAKNLISIKECVTAKYLCDYMACVDGTRTAFQEASVWFKFGSNDGSLNVDYKGNNVIEVSMTMVCGYMARTVTICDDPDELVKALNRTDAGWYCAFALLRNWWDIKSDFETTLRKLNADYRAIYLFRAIDDDD